MGRPSTLTRRELVALADVRIMLTPEGAAYLQQHRDAECVEAACREPRAPHSEYCADHDLCDAF